MSLFGSSFFIVVLITTIPASALASETTTYTYDAKGRLVKVVHTGTVNNGITKEYTYDEADNRKNLKVRGASPGFLTVPISSFSKVRRRNP